MNRSRWLLLTGFLLVGLVAACWWSRPDDVRLSFIQYQMINGERYALLAVENHGSEVLFCIGNPGTPDCHFRAEYPEGPMMGPGGPAASGIPGDVRIEPGARLEFLARLRLDLHRREVNAPFQAAIKYTTPWLLKRHRFLHGIAFPYRLRPSIERTVWTETISQ